MAVEHVQNLPPAVHSLPTRWLTQLMARLERGRLDVRFGETHYCAQGTSPGPQAELRITNPLRMLRKVATGGDVGFAEAYMDGDWDSPEQRGTGQAARSHTEWCICSPRSGAPSGKAAHSRVLAERSRVRSPPCSPILCGVRQCGAWKAG